MKSQFNLIRQPRITEKVILMKEMDNKVVFKVAQDTNKIEVKKAVESIFKVKVKKIATLNVRGKMKRQGRTEGKRADWKKAIVTLDAGDKIEYFEGA
ncbi:MAG: 50S ribosomal protein L23 [Proteobacteria bacterium]|nr:50S ribosomal protein L23 [Pseudomonadota bacterium]